jgi:YD repeat-containing protein
MDGGGGSDDDGNNMPPPEDAPATTDALTAGGGSNDDDDDDDNDDDSGGSRDDDESEDDTDNDSEPIPKDAPATTDALTAKKIECPPGQEVTLFSTTCGPTGSGTDTTQGTTSAATVCPPTSPTPTSYGMPEGLPVTNAVWGSNSNNHEMKTEARDTQQTHLHRIVTPERPGVTEENPALLALCTRQPVEVTNPDGTATTYDPDGTVTVKKRDGTETTNNPDGTKNIKKSDANGVATVDTYNGDNKLTSSIKLDPVTGRKLLATEYLPGSNARTSETTFSPYDGKPLQKIEFNPNGEAKSTTIYFKGTDKPQEVHEPVYNKAGKVKGFIVTTYSKEGLIVDITDGE